MKPIKAIRTIPTRQLLLETAGQLFAEHGFSGTSIKMIAEESGQNIAAVNYHFGSKQNLFINALKFVIEKIMTPIATRHEASHGSLIKELKNYITERCNFMLSSQTPLWYGKLIIRAGFEIHSSDRQTETEFYKPDFDYLENLCRKIQPGLDAEKAKLWAYSVVGQIFFYVFGRDMILMANQKTAFDAKTIKNIATHISELSTGWLVNQSGISGQNNQYNQE